MAKVRHKENFYKINFYDRWEHRQISRGKDILFAELLIVSLFPLRCCDN